MARQARKVESGDGKVQLESDGAGVQVTGGVVGGDGVGEGGTDEGVRGDGPESGGELLSQVSSAGPYDGSQTPHKPWNHNAVAARSGGWASGHPRRWQDLDHRSAC